MEWVEITVEGVIERLPTDVKAKYDAWLVSYPDKAGRLAEITANTIREFRDNIKSVPKNYWHEDETYLPQSAVRHVDTIIVFTLAMEMGLSIDTAGTAARYAADIFLRQILMGRYTTTTEEGGEGTPRYNAPTRDTAGRALPAFLAVMLAFVQFAAGGWIKPGDTADNIIVSYIPADYSISGNSLNGHLDGIDSEFGKKMPYSKTNAYYGNSSIVSWNFASTNGIDLFGFRFTPYIYYNDSSWINVTNLIPGLKFNFAEGTLTENKMGLLRENTIDIKSIIFVNYSPSSSSPQWTHNLLFESGFLKFVDTNSYMILTNTVSNSVISLIGFASTNSTGFIDGTINFYLNGTNIFSTAPICDGTLTKYDLPSYVYPWDVFEIKWDPGIAIPGRDVSPPWFLNSTPSESTAVVAYGLANSNYYGNTIDFHSRPVNVDLPTEPRNAVPLQTLEDQVADTLAAANAETALATFDRDFNGVNVRLNPRYDVISSSNSLAWKYAGQTIMRHDGEGAAVTPEIKAFEVESGDVATLTVWSYSDGATNLVPEYSTNLTLGAWERLTNSVISATNVDEYTAEVTFTNSLDRIAFFRLVDTSGGTGVPVTRFYGAVDINGDTKTAWPTGGTGTGDLAATNTPTAGQMLYASDTTKTNLYFADAPEGGTGGDAATLVVTQMPYLAQALVTGTVVGVYDNANVGFTETLLFGNANSNSFVFEELNGGIVTNLTTLANSTTQGILTASASGTKVTNGCVLRIGGASYGIQALTGGTNVTFLPALNSNTSYAVDSVRGISHTSVALHQGAAGTANGPFVALATGTKNWNGISVAPDGTTIYAVVGNGSIWKSVDAGATWVDLATGTKNWQGISVAPDGTTIYAAVWNGSIWKSVDAGATWTDLVARNKFWTEISVAPDGTTIYATVANGSIWKSVDAGATWVDLAVGNKYWYGISVAPDGTTIYATVNGGSIWKSTDSGTTWVDLVAGNKNWQGISVAPDGTTIYAVVNGGSIWKSTDSGATWVDLAAGNKAWIGISVAPDGTTIYAAVQNGSIWRSEWSAYAPVLGVGHTVATIPMATTTNWRYFNDLYFRDNSNFTGTFYSISWQTNCWSIWSTDSSSWRVVASNDAGDWKWNSNGTFVAQAGLTNNELGTLSYAVQASVSNRMSRADIDGLNDGTYKSAGGFLAGYSPRTAVTFLNRTTNLPPRVYERRVLVDDLRYEQKQANTNDYNLYVPGTNSALTIVTKKVARTCDVVIKYLKDQP